MKLIFKLIEIKNLKIYINIILAIMFLSYIYCYNKNPVFLYNLERIKNVLSNSCKGEKILFIMEK